VSWQIVPKVLTELLSSSDGAKSARAMQAMMGMQKLDIAALQRAYDGTGK
jgi:predicted 3-demethylubiquinone-9 3-methyltransferase (glyoxalase superfamily)